MAKITLKQLNEKRKETKLLGKEFKLTMDAWANGQISWARVERAEKDWKQSVEEFNAMHEQFLDERSY